jgi:hypothetical protein
MWKIYQDGICKISADSKEAEYLCFLSHELNYVDDEHYKIVSHDVGAVKAMLISLIQKVRN